MTGITERILSKEGVQIGSKGGWKKNGIIQTLLHKSASIKMSSSVISNIASIIHLHFWKIPQSYYFRLTISRMGQRGLCWFTCNVSFMASKNFTNSSFKNKGLCTSQMSGENFGTVFTHVLYYMEKLKWDFNRQSIASINNLWLKSLNSSLMYLCPM